MASPSEIVEGFREPSRQSFAHDKTDADVMLRLGGVALALCGNPPPGLNAFGQIEMISITVEAARERLRELAI